MRQLLIFLCFIVADAINSSGQYSNVWAFGSHAGIDFSTRPPRAIRMAMETSEGSSVICDDKGKLLFYTDGYSVWDQNHTVMPNGNGLPRVGFNITKSTAQGTIIVPIPGSTTQYYLLSLGEVNAGIYKGALFYSVVDMDLNGGLGAVVSTQKGILVDTGNTEHMMVSRGGPNCDQWWIIVRSGTDSKFKAFEITPNGVNSQPVVSPALPKPINGGWGTGLIGYMAISPNGKKIAIAQGNLGLYDFNATTGVITNPVYLDGSPDFPDSAQSNLGYYGVCFSPDNTKVYGGAHHSIQQFDLNAGNSKTKIADGDGLTIQRGPDGKLYCAVLNGDSLNVINAPNLPGISCGFERNGFGLLASTQSVFGLPTFVANAVTEINSSVTDTQICNGTSSLRAKSDAGWDYQWNDGTRSPLCSLSKSGTYWVTYQLPGTPCAINVDTFHVVLIPMPETVQIGPECKGAKNGYAVLVKDAQDTVTYYFSWKVAGDTLSLSTRDSLTNVTSGTYEVTLTNAHGCSTHLVFTIPNVDYKVSFQSDTLICKGSKVQFDNTSDPHFSTWHWSFGDTGSDTEQQPAYVYGESGRYVVTLIGSGASCRDTFSKTLIVDEPVTDIRFTIDRQKACVGESVLWTPIQTDQAVRLRWNIGDSAWWTAPDDAVRHAFDQEGEKIIQLSAHFRVCPVVFYADTVTIYAPPKVNLGGDTGICLRGQAVLLANFLENPPGNYTYWWQPIGATSATLSVQHPGIYSLRIKNEEGCSTTEAVRVHKDCMMDIPNAFTPNQDGINDYFFPRQWLASHLEFFSMQIFNRWGQMIFETNEERGRGWDGRYNGKDQPTGVYLYRIKAIFRDSKAEQLEGNVTLIR